MANAKFKLDRGGIREVLLSDEVRGVLDDLAGSVSAYADHTTRRGQVIPVETDSYTTDRAAAGVTLAHAAGLAIEAKYGTLAKAASAAGLEVRTK